MANTNFRTLNSRLVDRITKLKSPKAQKKQLNKIFNVYKRKMKQNSNKFFTNKEQVANFNNYTINTIYDRVLNHIETQHKSNKKGERFKKVQKLKTTDDAKHLKSVLNNLVRNSRGYQKQVAKNERLANSFEKYPENHLFDYIITHPITTEHSRECARDLTGSPYKRDDAMRIQKTKPNHVNCTCVLKPRETSKVLIEQGNF